MSVVLNHPSVAAILAIHSQVLNAHGGGSGLSSREMLESAAAAPQASMMGVPILADPIEIAAAYLCGNHAFVDGNKRVALATRLVFLSENGLLPDELLDIDAWGQLTLAVAAGKL